jgi:hypothetical protein
MRHDNQGLAGELEREGFDQQVVQSLEVLVHRAPKGFFAINFEHDAALRHAGQKELELLEVLPNLLKRAKVAHHLNALFFNQKSYQSAVRIVVLQQNSARLEGFPHIPQANTRHLLKGRGFWLKALDLANKLRNPMLEAHHFLPLAAGGPRGFRFQDQEMLVQFLARLG